MESRFSRCGARLASHRGAFVGHHVTIAARDRIEIGEGTFLEELVSVRDRDHDPSSKPSSGANQVGPVTIGTDCWIAAKVTITRNVDIGNPVVIGANAVVTRSLPDGVVAIGVPARILRDGSADPEE